MWHILRLHFEVLFLFVIGSSCQFGIAGSVPRPLPCPLNWVPVSYGEIPSNAVRASSHNPEHYIARRNVADGGAGGRVEKSSGFGYFVVGPGNQVQELERYEVLVNPNDQCVLAWTQDVEPGFSVETVVGSGLFIGRTTSTARNEILSGVVTTVGSAPTILLPVTAGTSALRLEEFEVLKSYVNGLHVDSSDLEFKQDLQLPAEIEFIGIDEIYNRSPARASQLVSHKNVFTETYTLRSYSSWGSTTKISLGFSLPLQIPVGGIELPLNASLNIGIKFEYTFTTETSESQTIHQVQEKEIGMSREINIGPHTAIQACSTATIIRDFEVEYLGRDKYSAPGFSAAAVNAILQEDGIMNGVEDPATGRVLVQREGSFSAALATMTKFLVMEVDGNGVGGCDELYEQVQAYKQAKKNGDNKERLQQLNAEIWKRVYSSSQKHKSDS